VIFENFVSYEVLQGQRRNTIKNKLEYVIMCNGDVDLSTFVMELNAK